VTTAITPQPSTADLEAQARASNQVVAALKAELTGIAARVDAAIDADDAPLVNRLRRRERQLPGLITEAEAAAQAAWERFIASRTRDLKVQQQQDVERAKQAQGRANGAAAAGAAAFAAALGELRRATETLAKLEAVLAEDPEVERRVMVRDAWAGWISAFGEACAAWMARPATAAPPDRGELSRYTDGRAAAWLLAYDNFFRR